MRTVNMLEANSSLWEVAVKHPPAHGGPDDMGVPAERALSYFDTAGYAVPRLEVAHSPALEKLPGLHGEPFDRMLVAQALATPLRRLRRDALVAQYGDTIGVV